MIPLHLEKYTAQDFDDYYALVRDEAVMKYITGEVLSKEDAQARFAKSIRQNDAHTIFGSYKIFIDNTYIGFGMVILDEVNNEAEIGYMLFPRFFKKGYGQQIANTLVALACKTTIPTVTAMIDPENDASRKILTRAGFVSVEAGIVDGIPTELFKQSLLP